MSKIIKQNIAWFSLFVLFLIVGGILLLRISTGDMILFFSDNRTEFGDFFFRNFTKVGEEPVYLALVFIGLFVRFRYSILIGATGLTVMLVSFLTKGYFAHDRPKMFFEKLRMYADLNLVDGVHVVTGQTSFPSGHTMSGFALFGMLAFLLPKKKYTGALMFLVAFFVGLSRIYLVQHFWKDVYLGAILGTVIAFFIYYQQSKTPINEAKWYDRKINFKKIA